MRQPTISVTLDNFLRYFYLLLKNQIYLEANAKRQELVNEYRQLQKQLYDEIRALGPETVAPAQDSATVEVDHSANIRAEHDQRKAEQVKQEAAEFTETMTDRIAEKEEMPKTESTTPEGYAEDTKREQLREAAEAEGATEEQADAFAKYSDDWLENLPEEVQNIIRHNDQLVFPSQNKRIKYEAGVSALDSYFKQDVHDLVENLEKSLGRKLTDKELDEIDISTLMRHGSTNEHPPNGYGKEHWKIDAAQQCGSAVQAARQRSSCSEYKSRRSLYLSEQV